MFKSPSIHKSTFLKADEGPRDKSPDRNIFCGKCVHKIMRFFCFVFERLFSRHLVDVAHPRPRDACIHDSSPPVALRGIVKELILL